MARSARRLELRLGSPGDALDRFEAAWNRTQEGGSVPQLDVLTFRDLPLLLKTLTPARWAIIEALGRQPAASIYELAKRLARDYKNVHTDVSRMLELGLLEKEEGGVRVAWRAIRAELRLER